MGYAVTIVITLIAATLTASMPSLILRTVIIIVASLIAAYFSYWLPIWLHLSEHPQNKSWPIFVIGMYVFPSIIISMLYAMRHSLFNILFLILTSIVPSFLARLFHNFLPDRDLEITLNSLVFNPYYFFTIFLLFFFCNAEFYFLSAPQKNNKFMDFFIAVIGWFIMGMIFGILTEIDIGDGGK